MSYPGQWFEVRDPLSARNLVSGSLGMRVAILSSMTNNETTLTVDSLLGAPNKAQVTAAAKYVQSFGTTTEALVALVAALREMEATAQAGCLEGLCEDMAEIEITEM